MTDWKEIKVVDFKMKCDSNNKLFEVTLLPWDGEEWSFKVRDTKITEWEIHVKEGYPWLFRWKEDT